MSASSLHSQEPQIAVLPSAPVASVLLAHGRKCDHEGANEEQGIVAPDVLAPAGGWPQLKAAVENGEAFDLVLRQKMAKSV